jgi:hypothetical protein
MNRWTQASMKNRNATKKRAQKLLSDTEHDRLRTRRGLAAVVAAYIAAAVVMAVVSVKAPPFTVVAIGLWAATLVMLRLAVRSQADLPDEVLDERMRSEREYAYLTAYRGVSGALVFAVLIALFVVVRRKEMGVVSLNYDAMNAVFWSLLSLVTGAPSISLALLHRQSQK